MIVEEDRLLAIGSSPMPIARKQCGQEPNSVPPRASGGVRVDAPAQPDREAFSMEKIGERARENAREILELLQVCCATVQGYGYLALALSSVQFGGSSEPQH